MVVCVCYHASYYMPPLYVKIEVSWSSLGHFLHLQRVASKFWHHLPTTAVFLTYHFLTNYSWTDETACNCFSQYVEYADLTKFITQTLLIVAK